MDALVRLVDEEQKAAKCEAESESGQHIINFEVLLGKYFEVF